MLVKFIESGADRSLAITPFHDLPLALLSIIAAYLGCYAGLEVVKYIRSREASNKRNLWLFFGILSCGGGLFTMHFIGILACKLPISFQLDLNLTLLSIIPSLLTAGWILSLLSKKQLSPAQFWMGGAIAGFGVNLMHHLGIASWHTDALIVFDPLPLTLALLSSVLFGVIALSATNLTTMTGLNPQSLLSRHLAAGLMAGALAAIHYSSISAVWIFPEDTVQTLTSPVVSPIIMGVSLTFVFLFLLTATFSSTYVIEIKENFNQKNISLLTILDKQYSRTFFSIFLTISILFSAIAWIAADIYSSTENSGQKAAAQHEIERVIKIAANHFESTITDMNIILTGSYLADFVRSASDKTKSGLAQHLLTIAQERRTYDQVRLIDKQGQEQIRINLGADGQALVVPESQLQNKSDRDYFKQALQLSKGELFVSRFDLNIEQGKIEKPFKPMIRFAAPVFDEQGNKQGVLILNYLGGILLDRVLEIFNKSGNLIYLTDQNGHLLISPNQADRWGFMFDRPPAFPEKFPTIWKFLQTRNQGSLKSDQGHFIFDRLIVELRPDIKRQVKWDKQDWKAVIHINETRFIWGDWANNPVAGVIIVCGIILSILLSWLISLLVVSRRISEESEGSARRELEFQMLALDEHAIVSATDVKGNITYVNEKFIAISGYTKEELLGKNHRMVKSDEHSPEFYQALWKQIANGRPWHGEVKNLNKAGKPYWVRASIVPFLDKKGKPFRYVSIRTDVTVMKDLEASLVVAKEGAEAAAHAKSDFLANMSHEIRTPMNAIIGLSHLCLQTRLTARQKDYIRKVHNSATSLLRIINDILDFSKIEAGRLDMEKIDFTLEEVLGNMSAMISMKAQEKQLEFLMETAVDIPPSLVGDPLRLGQILINLCNNAIKFTEKGEVAVQTEVKERSENTVRLKFTIRDTGIGMTPEQQKGLFQAFTQADVSITRKYGGTGLGLTISQRLVEMMDGTLRTESEKGVGSKFIFDVLLGVSNRMSEKVLIPTTDLRGMKVLVVDDNESARNVIADFLTSFTFKVSKVSDGKEGIIAVQEADMAGDPFDLVVIDYMMPEIDGITTATKIRNELGLIKPPQMIMATAYGEEAVVKRAAIEAQIDGFLVKPINQSLLFESIMEVFGEARAESDEHRVVYGASRNYISVLSGAQILVVEDNEINQQVARELLEQANITVTVAENGKQAIDIIGKQSFDGILMDVQMPVMDGLTASREIRKQPEFANLPILAMTANAMSGDRDQCLEAGMQDHIAKPVDPANLFSVLSRWVKPANPQPYDLSTKSDDKQADENTQHPVLDLPGIDTQTGLMRLGGNVERYLSVLTKFRANQGGAATKIREALSIADFATAERLAHTLKGVSGTIGADHLQEQSRALEFAIKSSDEPKRIQEHLHEVTSELDNLCSLLDERIAKPETQTPTNNDQGITERQKALLQTAVKQLDVYDAAVESTLESLRKESISNDLLSWIDRIEKQIGQYDFEEAASLLKQCIDNLKIEINQ
ncbi:MAG: response regulator [Magnetococcales bacterium]|nr:response regulator [Magnetococcales bacterium]